MSLWQRERGTVGLAATGAAWQGADGDFVRLEASLSAAGAALSHAEPSLRESACAVLKAAGEGLPRGQRASRLVLADSLARYWLMVPPVELVSLNELRQVARVRCAQLFGGGAQDWLLAGDWDASHPFVCVAVPVWIVDAARAEWKREPELCTLLQLLLRHLQPRLPGQGWACVHTLHHSAIVGMSHGRIVSLRVLPASRAAAPARRYADVAVELRRESMRSQLPADAPVVWFRPEEAGVERAAQEGVHVQAEPLFPCQGSRQDDLPVDEASLALWCACQAGMGR